MTEQRWEKAITQQSGAVIPDIVLRVQNRRIEDIPVPGLGFLFPDQEGNASVRRMDLFSFAPVAGT